MYFKTDLSTQNKNTSGDPWPNSQETRAARGGGELLSNRSSSQHIGMFDYCLVSIAEDASTLSDVANESYVHAVS